MQQDSSKTDEIPGIYGDFLLSLCERCAAFAERKATLNSQTVPTVNARSRSRTDPTDQTVLKDPTKPMEAGGSSHLSIERKTTVFPCSGIR